MQDADSSTVLGNFESAVFRHGDVTSTFFRRNGAYVVRTDGPDGALADFPVRYTFGVFPLQQYLVALPGGRLQALSIAWDARPAREGGQRWFHLYPRESIAHGDELHWTGPQQNWNFMCADCHSTNLSRNYDAATGAYRTTWSEVDVSCEACHGPGSAHTAWARAHKGRRAKSGDPMELAVSFRERRTQSWAIDPATGNARPHGKPLATEIETCAPCHSRRTEVARGYRPGRRLLDHYLPALLDTTLYFPDGQQREEVYEWLSFLESRMYASGVTCSDCHDPHSGRLRAEGNALCAQCHDPAKYDRKEHHGHDAAKPGGRCIACHMPERSYMVIHRRGDHSLRIPRPDLTLSLGVPNACQGCHGDRDARWAVEAMARWHPAPKPGFQRFASALAGSAPGRERDRRLAAVLGDSTQPEVARAAAAGAIAEAEGPDATAAARRALGDPSAWVRATAITAMARLPLEDQLRVLPPLLDDPARIARIEAARVLAGAPQGSMTDAQRRAFERSAAEYVESQRIHADRPEHRTNLGTFLAQRGRYAEAEAEFRAAIALLPTYVPAWANFADMRRLEGRDRDAEALLREGLRHVPAASLHHALGLTLVRLGRTAEAIPELALAARLDPGDPSFTYVYAIALHSVGRTADALGEIEGALKRGHGSLDLVVAGVTIARDAGDRARALRWAERLVAEDPSDPMARQLIEELRAGGSAARP
jgi:predicted CXXCH cytochrome family protein